MTDQPALRPLFVPCALIGAFALLVTFTKDLQNVWPLQPGLANWRFGALGFLLGTGALPVLGLALMAVVAGLGEFRGLARAVAVAGIGLGAMFLIGLVVFLVDSQAVTAQAGGGDAGSMVSGAIRRTTILGLFSGPAYLILGWASFRAAGQMADAERERLVVGSQ